MSKLRFALLCVHTCPLARLGGKDAGGMNVYVQNLARQLGQLGHSVDVFTRMHNPAHDTVMDIGRNARLIHLPAGDAAETSKLALHEHLPDFARQIEDFRQRDNGRYDVIFGHYWLSGLVGKTLAGWWGVPTLQMFHTLGIIKNTLDGEDEPALRLESERFLARDSTRVIASTNREVLVLRERLGADPTRTTVIPCGVDLDLFQPVDKDEARKWLGITAERVVLFVGRIETLKGLDRLIEATGRLEAPGLKLIILGGDEYSRREIERLRALAVRLGIDDRVSFLDPVPQTTLPAYYGAADVFVLPSHYESFGMVALEALACGTPVVATPVGDLQSIIKEGITGYIARDNSPAELAAKLGMALSSRNLGTPEMIRSSVLRFGWETIALSIAAECEKLTRKH